MSFILNLKQNHFFPNKTLFNTINLGYATYLTYNSIKQIIYCFNFYLNKTL